MEIVPMVAMPLRTEATGNRALATIKVVTEAAVRTVVRTVVTEVGLVAEAVSLVNFLRVEIAVALLNLRATATMARTAEVGGAVVPAAAKRIHSSFVPGSGCC